MLRMESHFSLISSQLLPKSQSLTLDCDFVFLIWQLIHSVLKTHSEMTFGCQAAAQGAPASTAKVFLRLNLQSLRWIASLFLIKPSLTCSVAPPFQNANISLVCILVFLPMLENSRTPCLFVHFTKGRVSVFDIQKDLRRPLHALSAAQPRPPPLLGLLPLCRNECLTATANTPDSVDLAKTSDM